MKPEPSRTDLNADVLVKPVGEPLKLGKPGILRNIGASLLSHGRQFRALSQRLFEGRRQWFHLAGGNNPPTLPRPNTFGGARFLGDDCRKAAREAFDEHKR